MEQILGRVLRLPHATRKRHAELNCAYALAASPRFIAAAQSLKDALVENGFERMEAELYVSGDEAQATFFGAGTLFFEAEQVVPERPDLTHLPAELRERVTFDPKTSTLAVDQGVDRTGQGGAGAMLYHARSQEGGRRRSIRLRTGGPSRPKPRRPPAARSACPCWQSGLTASLSYSRKAIFSTRLGGFRSVTPA